MIDNGRFNVLGVNVHAVDYEAAVSRVIRAATARRPCTVSALAVHGVMTGAQDEVHRRRLNGLDLTVPDGQPVRWALALLHKQRLPDRVYGPTLMLKVAEAAAREGIPVYLYGSTPETIELLADRLVTRIPGLRIVGKEPSQFRRLTREEKLAVAGRIRDSGAGIVFVGLGCPRQETWAFEYRDLVGIPILAVGAAFDFHAGSLPQAPAWMQRAGLEWLFRLIQEPARLWKRYLILNPAYVAGVTRQLLRPRLPDVSLPDGREPEESFG